MSSGDEPAGESFQVVLNVYDISQGMARQLATAFLGQPIDAVYHTGVVVYGREYWFGGGIETGSPGRTYFGPPMQVLPLGSTGVSPDLFHDYLSGLEEQFNASTYSLLSNNCNHFSDEVASFLVGKGIPRHILQLPDVVMSSPNGHLLEPLLRSMENMLKSGAQARPTPLFHPTPTPAAVPTALPPPAPARAPTAPPAQHLQPSQASTAAASRAGPCASGEEATEASRKGEREGGHGLVPSLSSSPAPASAPPKQHTPVPPASAAHGVGAAAPQTPSAGPSSAAAEGAPGAGEGTAGRPGGDSKSAKELVEEEVRREFAALLAIGGLTANEAAAQALQRVMHRRRASAQLHA